MQFTSREILVITLAVIILVCAVIITAVWFTEGIQMYIKTSHEDDMDDTIEFDWDLLSNDRNSTTRAVHGKGGIGNDDQ